MLSLEPKIVPINSITEKESCLYLGTNGICRVYTLIIQCELIQLNNLLN